MRNSWRHNRTPNWERCCGRSLRYSQNVAGLKVSGRSVRLNVVQLWLNMQQASHQGCEEAWVTSPPARCPASRGNSGQLQAWIATMPQPTRRLSGRVPTQRFGGCAQYAFDQLPPRRGLQKQGRRLAAIGVRDPPERFAGTLEISGGIIVTGKRKGATTCVKQLGAHARGCKNTHVQLLHL